MFSAYQVQHNVTFFSISGQIKVENISTSSSSSVTTTTTVKEKNTRKVFQTFYVKIHFFLNKTDFLTNKLQYNKNFQKTK